MSEEDRATHTVTLLPWLKLPVKAQIDLVVFWPFPAEEQQFDPEGIFGAHLRHIFSSYVDILGNPITELTIASFLDNPFKDLSSDEAQRISELIRLLAFSVMAENDYYQQVGQPFNSTHFQHFHQVFELGSTWIAPVTRRREGRTHHGGYRHGELKFTIPLQAVTTSRPRPNVPLLETLVDLLRQDTQEATSVRQAIDWFFLANSDSDAVPPQTEIVMFGSAFEALLEVQDAAGKKQALIDGLPGLFSSCLVEEVEREGTDGTRTTRSWKAWWVDEFYWLRNRVVHGGRIHSRQRTWDVYEHLTIAAIVLAIGVKLKLAQLGRYTLTSREQTSADAIDFFVAEGQLSEEKLQRARRKASLERASRKALERLGGEC